MYVCARPGLRMHPRWLTFSADRGQEAYTGIIPHLHLETLIRRRSEEWWSGAIRGGDSILVLEVGKATAGYATSGAARTRTAHQGEIYELYLAPVYQGLGFGELLFEGCRAGLDRRQLRGLVVWALSENSGATDFYWRRGGRPFRPRLRPDRWRAPRKDCLRLALKTSKRALPWMTFDHRL